MAAKINAPPPPCKRDVLKPHNYGCLKKLTWHISKVDGAFIRPMSLCLQSGVLSRLACPHGEGVIWAFSKEFFPTLIIVIIFHSQNGCPSTTTCIPPILRISTLSSPPHPWVFADKTLQIHNHSPSGVNTHTPTNT